MRTDKSTAVKLRLKGKSYGEIQKSLGGISKSTLSAWLKNVLISSGVKNKLDKRSKEKSLAGLIKRNKRQTILAKERAKSTRASAAKEIGNISENDLFFIGLALYWAEGYKRVILKNGVEKTYHPVSMTNSDPELVKVFIRFLKISCKVDPLKIKANLRIFRHLNEKNILDFWVKETGIPESNFDKTYLGISKSSMGKRPFNRLPFGVIQIRINDTQLFHRIMGWIEGLKISTNK